MSDDELPPRGRLHISIGLIVTLGGIVASSIVFVFGVGGYVSGQRSDIARLTETVADGKHEAAERATNATRDLQAVRDDMAAGLATGTAERKQETAIIGDMKDQVAVVKEGMAKVGAQQDFMIEELRQMRTQQPSARR